MRPPCGDSHTFLKTGYGDIWAEYGGSKAGCTTWAGTVVHTGFLRDSHTFLKTGYGDIWAEYGGSKAWHTTEGGTIFLVAVLR